MTDRSSLDVFSSFTAEEWRVVRRLQGFLSRPEVRTSTLEACYTICSYEDYCYICEAVHGLTAEGFQDDDAKLDQHWNDVLVSRPSYIALVGLAACVSVDITIEDFMFLKRFAHGQQARLYGTKPTKDSHELVEIQIGPTPDVCLRVFTDHRRQDATSKPK